MCWQKWPNSVTFPMCSLTGLSFAQCYDCSLRKFGQSWKLTEKEVKRYSLAFWRELINFKLVSYLGTLCVSHCSHKINFVHIVKIVQLSLFYKRTFGLLISGGTGARPQLVFDVGKRPFMFLWMAARPDTDVDLKLKELGQWSIIFSSFASFTV